MKKGANMAEKEQFDLDDAVEYLRDGYFHLDDPDPDDVFEFASEDELEGTDEPTDEMLDRYHEYVEKCVGWAQHRMAVSDEFRDILTNAIECSKWADDYDMFTAAVRDFLDAQGADKRFSRIKDDVIHYRVNKTKSNLCMDDIMKDVFPRMTEEQSIAATAVLDMLHIQALQEHLNDAIGRGAVVPFDEHVRNVRADSDTDTDPILYIPSKSTGYGIIVCDNLVDPIHADIISTYGGLSWTNYPSILISVDAYLSWAIVGTDEDGNTQWQLDGLCVVPKGSLPSATRTFDWSASASWPDGMEQPPCPEPIRPSWA
jgi:hypothetical protein